MPRSRSSHRTGKSCCTGSSKEPPNEFAWYRDLGEIRIADLESGRSEPVARGFQALNYEISADGRQVVMQSSDSQGKSRLWHAPIDRSSPPQQIPNVEGVSPRFGPGGEIFFRHVEGTNMVGSVGSIYRVRMDGTGLRKALENPVLLMNDFSPDGSWLTAWAPLPNGIPAIQLLPLDGGSPTVIGGGTMLKWAADGSSLSITAIYGIIPEGRSYLISLPPGQIIPRIPAGGFHSEQEIASLPGARRIDARGVVPGPSPDVYAFYRGATQRNLYRVPIP